MPKPPGLWSPGVLSLGDPLGPEVSLCTPSRRPALDPRSLMPAAWACTAVAQGLPPASSLRCGHSTHTTCLQPRTARITQDRDEDESGHLYLTRALGSISAKGSRTPRRNGHLWASDHQQCSESRTGRSNRPCKTHGPFPRQAVPPGGLMPRALGGAGEAQEPGGGPKGTAAWSWHSCRRCWGNRELIRSLFWPLGPKSSRTPTSRSKRAVQKMYFLKDIKKPKWNKSTPC